MNNIELDGGKIHGRISNAKKIKNLTQHVTLKINLNRSICKNLHLIYYEP